MAGASAKVIYSMSVSADGFVTDRSGDFRWTAPSEAVFEFHLARVAELGACILGRKLYETMLVWETDPALRSTPAFVAFADVWSALPKVVFSRTLRSVQGHARLASASLADEIAATLAAVGKPVEIGGADLAGQAVRLGLVDEMRVFRYPTLLGGGTPFFPPLDEQVHLELLEARQLDPTVAYERYGRRRDQYQL